VRDPQFPPACPAGTDDLYRRELLDGLTDESILAQRKAMARR
jgi:hypothetical protein